MIHPAHACGNEQGDRQLEYHAERQQKREQEIDVFVNREHRRGQILARNQEKIEGKLVDIAVAERDAQQKQQQRHKEQHTEQADLVIIERRADESPDLIEDERADQHDAGDEGDLELCGEGLADRGVDDLHAARLNGRGDELHQRGAEEIERDRKSRDHRDCASSHQLADSHQVAEQRLCGRLDVFVMLAGRGLLTHPSFRPPYRRRPARRT